MRQARLLQRVAKRSCVLASLADRGVSCVSFIS